MAITISRWQIYVVRSAASAWSILVLIAPARAADWNVVPALHLRESYSDNVLLAPPAQAQGDVINEIAPSISILGNGPRLKLSLAYTLQKLMYQRQPDRNNQQLSASANGEILEDWFFVDLRSSVSQQNISAFGPQPVDNVGLAANQSTVRANTVSPFLRHHFRDLATAELRYSHDAVSSNDNLLAAKTDELQLKLTGDRQGHGWSWGANTEQKSTHDNSLDTVHMSRTTLTLNYPPSSRLNLFASTGYEKEGYTTSMASQPSGRSWSIGAGWYPSGRTSVVASGGKRFFGNTYSLEASHHSHHTTWTLNYGEDISSTPAELMRLSSTDTANLLNQLWSASIPDPQLRQQQVNTFLRFSQLLGPDVGAVNYFTHSYFLQKQMSLNMVTGTPKNTLLLGLSSTRRSAQTSSAIDSVLLPAYTIGLDDQTRQSALNGAWNWRMSARNSFSASASYGTVKSLTLNRLDSNLVFSASLNRIVRPKVSASIDVRHVRHGSTGGGDYRENALGVSLNFTL
ncbi:uncharacterized protein (PEP-CTERM system associated) [Oxalobacteraceae bacterium GrIS 1.11]